jgi:hypothetical protein
MSTTYETTGLTYINTIDYSQNYDELGLEPYTKDVVFVAMSFYYTARCYTDIIQYVQGQRLEEPLYNNNLPTKEEFVEHNLRKEMFNGEHQPLQDWIDNLNQ